MGKTNTTKPRNRGPGALKAGGNNIVVERHIYRQFVGMPNPQPDIRARSESQYI